MKRTCKNIYTQPVPCSLRGKDDYKCEPACRQGWVHVTNILNHKHMKNIKSIKSVIIIQITLFYLLFFIPVRVYSQSEREIKLSGEYYFGEGTRDSIHLAKGDAREDLLYKISAMITTETSLVTAEEGEDIKSFYKQTTKLYSSLKLKGIRYFEKEMADERIKVLAFISKEDYRKSIDEIISDIGDQLKLAERIENEYGLNSAVELYYQAYLKSYYCPEPIPYTSKLHNEDYKSVRPLLETKIRTFLSNLELTAGEPQYDELYPDQIMIPVKAFYNDTGVNSIEIRFDIPGNPVRLIEDGEVFMFIYFRPTRAIDDCWTILSIEFNDDPELEQIHKNFGIIEKERLQIDFSTIMHIDFTIEKKGGGFLKFTPDLGCVSIAKIEWIFGDGLKSNELNPIHKYKDPGEYKVALSLNNDDNLVAQKVINSEGEILTDLESPRVIKTTEQIPNELSNATVAYLHVQIQDNKDKSIVESLKSLKLSGNLMYGRKSHFRNPDNCYIIVLSTDGKKVLGFLTPAKPDRLDLLTNTKIKKLSDNYKNMRAIWVEIY